MKTLYSVLLIAFLITLSSVVTYSAEAAGIPKGAISTTGQWATTDLPKGTINNGFLKASTDNTPSYSTISAGDVPDLSSTYAKLNGGKVPNSLLPDAVVRTNQTNTFGAYAQTFASIILGGDLDIGSNALTNSGHRVFIPSNSGTVCLTNQTGPCGAVSSGTVTGSQNIGKGTGSFGVLSTPSSTTIKGKNLTAGTGISISGNSTDITLTSLITQGFTSIQNIGKGTGSLGLLKISGNTVQGKNLTAGTGISISGNSTDVTLANNGVTSIAGTGNNITASSSTGAVTLRLGPNVVVTGDLSQTVSKALTLNSLILGGTMDVNGKTLTNSGHVSTFPSHTGTLAQLNSTFTSATIDANTNTISNLADANVKTGAAIAWSKISKSGSSIHDLANVTSTGCAAGDVLEVTGTSPNGKWTCIHPTSVIDISLINHYTTLEEITSTASSWRIPALTTYGGTAHYLDLTKIGSIQSAEFACVYVNTVATATNQIALTIGSSPQLGSVVVTPISSSITTYAGSTTYPQTFITNVTPSQLSTGWVQIALYLANAGQGPDLYSCDLILYK